ESTTTMSSAKQTDSSAGPMSAASFLVMTVTESFGTVRSVLPRHRHRGRDRAEGHLLHRFEVDERFVVVGDRQDFGRPREREIALRLEHEEGLAHAGGHLLFFRFELLLLQ